MTISSTSSDIPSARSRRRGPVAGLLTALLMVVVLAGCGRTISIQDSDDAPDDQTSSSQSSRDEAEPEADSNAVQVVDGSAEDNGESGDGGTAKGDDEQEEPPAWVQLSAVQSEGLDGAHLINVNQAALYRFDEDSDDPSTTTCEGRCARTWPPVTIEERGNIYLAGVPRDQVGAIKREDGDIQLTVGGWPVYRFSGDSEPGDLEGQGVDDSWFAVGPQGDRVR